MTLDEAIVHAENVATRKLRESDKCFRHGGSAYKECGESLRECAVEHRQLAEWLKELKAYRETYPYGVDRFNGSDTPQTDLVEDDKCFDCEDFFDCDEHQTDCPWR